MIGNVKLYRVSIWFVPTHISAGDFWRQTSWSDSARLKKTSIKKINFRISWIIWSNYINDNREQCFTDMVDLSRKQNFSQFFFHYDHIIPETWETQHFKVSWMLFNEYVGWVDDHRVVLLGMEEGLVIWERKLENSLSAIYWTS